MKTIFVSIGLDDNGANENGRGETNTPAYPPLDKVTMQYCLNAIFSQAVQNGPCKIVLRDHPAITSLAQAHLHSVQMHDGGTGLVRVSEKFDAAAIHRRHKPDIVFYLGGDRQVMRDYEFFRGACNTVSAPLRGTGGAAQLADDALPADAAAQIDGGGRRDQWGFDRIARLMATIRPSR